MLIVQTKVNLLSIITADRQKKQSLFQDETIISVPKTETRAPVRCN